MNLSYSFFIRVEENGERKPAMTFFPPRYEMLSHLGEQDLSNSINVSNVLNLLRQSLHENQSYSFSGDDWCLVTINGPKARIISGFDEFESFELESNFILELLEGWKQFLIKYENRQIPGLTY